MRIIPLILLSNNINLNASCVPGSVLGARSTAMNKISRTPCPCGARILVKEKKKWSYERVIWCRRLKQDHVVDGGHRTNSRPSLLGVWGGSQCKRFSVLKLGQSWANWDELAALGREPFDEVVRASLKRWRLIRDWWSDEEGWGIRSQLSDESRVF